MITTLTAVVVAYLLGSVLGSMVAGRFRGVDIRTQGSGNPGGTNALRTQGKGFAAIVMIVDVGKGMLAAGAVPALAFQFGEPSESLAALQVLCGAAAVVGHVWPAFFGFRGGKGMATLVGVLAVVAPVALITVVVVFALVLVLSGYVGLATMVATASIIVWCVFAVPAGIASPLGVFAVAMTVFIIYTHRSNIQRMRAGSEHRFERLMLLRRWR
ncbi:MAG: glycerol-3-phosphate 1-O-acyltransferase PlsY [Gammaproteobacteria bacterium]